MAFSPQFLEEVRVRVGLADVIGKRIRLVRKGREFIGLCPFHNEKTPSFSVNEDKGFYHCFGCGAHGSVFDFVMQTEGLGFRDAVERLAVEAGMEVPRDSPEEAAKERRRQTLSEVVEAAAAYYSRMLRRPEGRSALAYLRERGVDDTAIARFGLGYAPAGRSALNAALGRDGIAEELMVEAGLLIAPNSDLRAPYDRFRNRLMFPIADRSGHTVGFGGRVLGIGEPKYLNSPENPLFQKGKLLYGLAQAKESARKEKTLVVVEGYMDVIALSRAGLENVVAPLGTALTEEQIHELWRLVSEPVLCFDGDDAGRRAAAKAAERVLPLLRPSYRLRFALLPDGEDPDSLINREGAEGVRRVLANPMPLSDFIWHAETKGRPPRAPEKRLDLWKKLKDHLNRVSDRDAKKELRDTFYESLWPEKSDRRRSGMQSGRKQMPWHPFDGGTMPAAATDPFRDAEKTVLAIVINHPGFFQEIEEEIGSVCFADTTLDQLRQGLISLLSGETDIDAGDLKNLLRERGLAEALATLMEDPVIKIHRIFGPSASEDEVRSKYDEAMRVLQAAAFDVELKAACHTEDYSDEGMVRRLKLKRASLNDVRD
ncbi:MAG: DNA primase [Kiloniellales bacterium]|nr:DNA primase [Kiloniellales bacterium]